MNLDRPEKNEFDPVGLSGRSGEIINLLKALGHEGRLAILCHLASGPKNVGELEVLLSSRQAVVSQCLSRLRLERIVETRREGKAIYYSISDPRVQELLVVLERLSRKAGPGND